MGAQPGFQRMQRGTEDIGPEDLTGISAVRWHESFKRYDASCEGVPAKPTAEQRAALVEARKRLVEDGITARGGVVTW